MKTSLKNVYSWRALPKRALVVLALTVSTTGQIVAAGNNAPDPVALNPAIAAPVAIPDSLKIKRPSAEDVAALERDLEVFVNALDLKKKTLLAEFPGLVAVRPPRKNPAVTPDLYPAHRTKHLANVERAKQGDIDVLFMGDSITDMWRAAGPAGSSNPPMAGKAVFDRYFGSMKVANFGIAGDSTQGVLYRLRDGEGEGFEPKVIMLMIGTNNTNSCSSAEIAEGIGAVVLELQQRFKSAKILLLGIFPRNNPYDAIRTTIAEINSKIEKLGDGKSVIYMDIGKRFLDEKGFIQLDIMSDKLHPTEKGYEIWAEAVAQVISELAK